MQIPVGDVRIREKLIIGLFPFLLLLISALPAHSALEEVNLQGARNLLSRISQEAGSIAEEIPSTKKENPAALLKQDLERFNSEKLQDAEAAAVEWVSLVRRFWNLSQAQLLQSANFADLYGQPLLTLKSFIVALPGPESWPYLEREVEQGSGAEENSLENNCLKIMVSFLNGRMDEVTTGLDRLEESIAQKGLVSIQDVSDPLAQLRNFVYRATINEPALIIENFGQMIEARKKLSGEKGIVAIPDLVHIAGQEKAAELIGQTLLIKDVVVDVPAGGETLTLAKKIAAARIDSLDKPQWKLITSPDDLELFEAFHTKFGNGAKVQQEVVDVFSEDRDVAQFGIDNSDETEARLYYILGLVKHGKSEDAIAFTLVQDLAELSDYDVQEVWDNVDQSRLAQPMLQFCSRVLSKKPALPFWDLFAKLAIALDENEFYLDFLNRLSKDGKNFKMQSQIESRRIQAYLAQGDIDTAVRLFREIEQINPESIPAAGREDFFASTIELGLQLAKIGNLLERQDLMQIGSNMMKNVAEGSRRLSPGLDKMELFTGNIHVLKYCDWLIEAKRFQEAETILVDSIVSKMKKLKGMELEISLSQMSPLTIELVYLTKIYSKAGRHEDVLILLEDAPWWGKRFLNEIDESSVSLAAARALGATGRKHDAIGILKRQIYSHPADDSLYQALIEFSDEDLVPWLDNLYQMDRFEERPLIWKAVILFNGKMLDQAEKVIREALKVDPTDGEQKAGDRVRAYAVLSDILAAKGNHGEAEFFSNVVQSVRIAEKGDTFNKLGLIGQSLDYYSEAEVLFGDAYCVQWRKAERLYEMGKYAEAEKHYAIAFERMPEQFGQVASFCFGCEGVFDKKHSRSIAETVLLRLEKTNPDRPQVYFLLGQLREAQENYTQAYTYFTKAVELDHDYLDAWKRMVRLHDKIFLTQDELNAITLILLKLDPLQKHFNAELDRVSNFKELWPVLEESARLKQRFDAGEEILTLSASAKNLDQAEKKLEEIMPERMEMYREFMNTMKNQDNNAPGEVLSRHLFMEQIANIIDIVRFSL